MFVGRGAGARRGRLVRRRKVANPNLDSGEAKESADGSRRLAALSGVTLHEVLEPLLRLLQVMGVSRKEVLAVVRKLPIVKLATPVTVVRGRLEYWSQAVMRWAADPKFLGVDGRPRDLAFSSGELSFCDLVALSLPRERPALCRDILLATGAIIRLPSGRLRWRERAALAKGADSGVVLADEYLRPLKALLLVLQSNLLRRAQGAPKGAFQMGVSGFEISHEDMAHLQKFVARHGTALLETVDDWIANREHERQRVGSARQETVRPYLGLYLSAEIDQPKASRNAPRSKPTQARRKSQRRNVRRP
jgi:uncharacterized protein DUF6502